MYMDPEMTRQAMTILTSKVMENIDKISGYVSSIVYMTGDEHVRHAYRQMVDACGDFAIERMIPSEENLRKVVRLLNNTEG